MFRLVLPDLSLLFFFSLPLAASTHDWDFPADKVLASLGANLLLAKPALWLAGCVVTFDANRTRVCRFLSATRASISPCPHLWDECRGSLGQMAFMFPLG